ncbi:hypothetical protein, partial [Streptomyces syringium]|uniref:hypothetical protein n=1 Tax=Streptomyces syringium TaxID=76729 RepID=UPI0033BBB9A9
MTPPCVGPPSPAIGSFLTCHPVATAVCEPSGWRRPLKANYPAEYMSALLTSVKDDKDKSATYLNEW